MKIIDHDMLKTLYQFRLNSLDHTWLKVRLAARLQFFKVLICHQTLLKSTVECCKVFVSLRIWPRRIYPIYLCVCKSTIETVYADYTMIARARLRACVSVTFDSDYSYVIECEDLNFENCTFAIWTIDTCWSYKRRKK